MKTQDQNTRVCRQVMADAERLSQTEERAIATMSPGDVLRQGDLYLVLMQPWEGGEPGQEQQAFSLSEGAYGDRGYAEKLTLRALTGEGAAQLAPGSSRGSRHIMEGEYRTYDVSSPVSVGLMHSTRLLSRAINALDPRFSVDDRTDNSGAPVALGPLVVVYGGATLTHPEHGNRQLPKGLYGVVYQRDPLAGRVFD